MSVSVKISSILAADLQYAIHQKNKFFQIHSNSQQKWNSSGIKLL